MVAKGVRADEEGARQVLDLSKNALTEIVDMALPLLKTLLLNDNQACSARTSHNLFVNEFWKVNSPTKSSACCLPLLIKMLS